MMTAALPRSDLEELLICAVRYCLPRHTYVVADADRWVRTLWPELTANTRRIIQDDVARALASDSPYYVMEMDQEVWRALHEFITRSETKPTTLSDTVIRHAGSSFEHTGPCEAGCDQVGYLNEHGFWMDSYVRVGTRVLYLPTARVGTIAEHDHAWNNRVEFDHQSTRHQDWNSPIWARAPAFARADGTPLLTKDHTTVRGAGR